MMNCGWWGLRRWLIMTISIVLAPAMLPTTTPFAQGTPGIGILGESRLVSGAWPV
jgi:hypothetical protein